MKKRMCFFLFILSAVHVMAQESDKEEVKPHKIALSLSVTHIPDAFEEGQF